MFGDTGSDGEHVHVEDDLFGSDACFRQELVSAFADSGLACVGCGLAFFVEGHHDHRGAEVANLAGFFQETVRPFFQTDGVDDAFALGVLQSGQDAVPVGRVDHQGGPGDGRVVLDLADETFHCSGTVEHRVIHVDVDDGSAAFDLAGGNLQGRSIIAGGDQPGEFARTGHIGPFTDRRQVVVPDVDRHVFQAAHAEQSVRLAERPGRDIFQGGCKGRDMVGCRAAAAANDIHASGLGGLPDGIGHLSGKFLVLAHGVGQAGVRVADYGEVADMGEVFHQRHQSFSSQRTVEAEGQEGIMPDGGQERFDRLSGQGPSGAVAGRNGDDGREAGTHLRKRV